MRIRMEEALRYLGAKEASEESIALIEGAWQRLQRTADPRHRVMRVAAAVSGERVKIADFEAASASLALNLRGCNEAYLLAATLGAGVDREMTKLSAVNVAEAFALQAAAASVLECFCDDICDDIAEELKAEGLYLRPRFSPGYGGFSTEHQSDILRILDGGRIGMGETSSHMLTPLKSVTAVMGISVQQGICRENKCEACDKTDCLYRKEANQ